MYVIILTAFCREICIISLNMEYINDISNAISKLWQPLDSCMKMSHVVEAIKLKSGGRAFKVSHATRPLPSCSPVPYFFLSNLKLYLRWWAVHIFSKYLVFSFWQGKENSICTHACWLWRYACETERTQWRRYKSEGPIQEEDIG